MTIGFSPRYFRTNACSFAPSLDTTASYSGVSTTASRWGGRGPGGRGMAAAAGTGGGGAGRGVAGAVCAGAFGAGASWDVGKKNIW